MCRTFACALFFLANANVSLAASISPVQKVISLIDDFAAKVQKEIDVASKLFEENAKYCDDEAVEKEHAITGTSEDIESMSAVVENEKAKLVKFATNIEDASGRISALEGDLHKTNEEREKEHQDFLANEKELLSTIDQLEGAAAKMKKFAFAQMTPDAKQGLDNIVGALSNVVEASFVTTAQREKVKAFLQARADSEDDLTLASHSKGGSDSIIETLDQMTEKAEGTLADARKAEMESNHAFMMVKQGMESEIKSTNGEMQQNTMGKALSTETLAQTEKDLAIAKKALAADTTYLSDLKRKCQETARSWEAEHKDGNAEMKALSAAKAILTKKFSLIESKAKLSSKRHDDLEDSKARALRAIEQLGRKTHSTALVSLAYAAASDPFGKVRGMVEDMIAKLQQEAAEAASQKAMCDEEMGKSTKSREKKEMKLEKTNARIEKAEAGVAKLSEQITELSREVAEIDGAVKEATALRQEENAAFRVADKDFSESEQACASAIEVLREYYEGAAASLIQVSLERDGSGIIGLLEVAESDFAKLLADARTSEDAGADAYQKLTQENKLDKATKEAERKGKESEVKTLKTSLADNNEDKESVSSELDAVLQYLAELKPQCETKAPSYAEKKAKREQEIDGLKDALEILSGDAVLVQKARHLRRMKA